MMKVKPENTDIIKAEQLVRRLKQRKSIAKNSTAKGVYEDMIQELLSSVKLSNGPVPDRSAHWKRKLKIRIDLTVSVLSETSKTEKDLNLTADSNYVQDCSMGNEEN